MVTKKEEEVQEEVYEEEATVTLSASFNTLTA